MGLPAPDTLAAALTAAYAGVTTVVRDLDDFDLLLPSGCRGWTVCDLLLHLSLDPQRALVAFATPADGPADTDYVTYFRSFPGAGESSAIAHAQWVRRTASAFTRPSGVVERWTETVAAAGYAAGRADPASLIRTQNLVLPVPDFIATLVTEAVIHHLDLIVSLPDAPDPAPEAVAIAMSTVDGLAGGDGLPPHWSEREALLKCSGREELTAGDREALGERAELFPLLS
ncbi:maleylpyruvate isomerase N-terminal domain-containing protein [Actinoplanes auranticolor]|uniref:Maleylpyruvate isomerase n=1 Tax=Actinoplanes auranticolor TaxID=47988 RepID=A0A919SLY8_9ACTN|nr:maleylpyruvate isomerase N-terminal domain-containing protein [Actinoplanes auranticolor]GIM75240.1 maleylpyruvate isomerase [Actinoplanes auranticolor]